MVAASRSCAPSMGAGLKVKVLPEAGHSDRREPQSVDPRGRREGSGKRSCGPMYKNRVEATPGRASGQVAAKLG